MTRPVSYRGEMISFGKIKDARKRAAMACFQALLQLPISIPVSVIVDTRAQPPSRFDQRDLEPGVGQNVRGDAAPWPATNDAHIKNLFRHRARRDSAIMHQVTARANLGFCTAR